MNDEELKTHLKTIRDTVVFAPESGRAMEALRIFEDFLTKLKNIKERRTLHSFEDRKNQFEKERNKYAEKIIDFFKKINIPKKEKENMSQKLRKIKSLDSGELESQVLYLSKLNLAIRNGLKERQEKLEAHFDNIFKYINEKFKSDLVNQDLLNSILDSQKSFKEFQESTRREREEALESYCKTMISIFEKLPAEKDFMVIMLAASKTQKDKLDYLHKVSEAIDRGRYELPPRFDLPAKKQLPGQKAEQVKATIPPKPLESVVNQKPVPDKTSPVVAPHSPSKHVSEHTAIKQNIQLPQVKLTSKPLGEPFTKLRDTPKKAEQGRSAAIQQPSPPEVKKWMWHKIVEKMGKKHQDMDVKGNTITLPDTTTIINKGDHLEFTNKYRNFAHMARHFAECAEITEECAEITENWVCTLANFEPDDAVMMLKELFKDKRIIPKMDDGLINKLESSTNKDYEKIMNQYNKIKKNLRPMPPEPKMN